jgi:hypothetical protein
MSGRGREAIRESSPVADADAADWMELMKRGDFAAAWRLSDRALEAGQQRDWTLPRHEQAIWTGVPLAGKRVLVRCYHGLGDTLQFIRYLPMLSRMARHVTVWIQPDLIDLLADTPELGELIPLHDGTPDAYYDADVEIMELPHVFRTEVATIPVEVPYIRGIRPRSVPAAWCRVGIVWKAGGWDPRRSIPFDSIRPLLDVQGVRFTALHERLTAAEASCFPDASAGSTIRELAAWVLAQELVITVDTMVAHLAGALGMRTWLLLHADPDWRWMRERRDSPWYPSMRLYRQPAPDAWQPVIRSVRSDLAEVAASRGRTAAEGIQPAAGST